MTNGFEVTALTGVIIVAVVFAVWNLSRSRSLLDQWAEQNGFEIIHSELRSLRRGPFLLTTTKGQTVYYVTVRDINGVEHCGWVRCGGALLGLLSDKTEVRWVEEPKVGEGTLRS